MKKSTFWKLALITLTLTACNSQNIVQTDTSHVNKKTIPSQSKPRLDVDIVILDPGIDRLDQDTTVTTPGIRRAESHYIAQRLRDTLIESDRWGSVLVVPNSGREIDLTISGKILESDGEVLKLEISTLDSRNKKWFTKIYKEKVTRFSYDPEIRREQIPFKKIYDRIEKDILREINKAKFSTLTEIKNISEMRFASNFAKERFNDSFKLEGKQLKLVRLPDESDPDLRRIRQIRKREKTLMEHLQSSYELFDTEMSESYDYWRLETLKEKRSKLRLEKQGLARTLGGALAVVGGIVAQASTNPSVRAIGQVGILGGAFGVKSGLDKYSEAKIHTAVLTELSESLNAHIQPATISLTDKNIEISGNAEEQFKRWRQIMGKIYKLENPS